MKKLSQVASKVIEEGVFKLVKGGMTLRAGPAQVAFVRLV
jgi:hypothetical protein